MSSPQSIAPPAADQAMTSRGGEPSLGLVMVLAAMAGGLGGGIRGQYGHETGAMIAGALVGLTLVLLLGRDLSSLTAARAVAWCTVAIGFGGSMTYGQTIGLTQDAVLIGQWSAWWWGMLGLAVKGGLWIGFAGVFLGMGLGGILYRPGELLMLVGVMLGMFFLGVWLLNSPFDPDQQVLPALYFSESWRWKPGGHLHPRREVWGGLLVALITLMVYVHYWRHDRLARNLGGWAIVGGVVGFPLGQCLQSFHAWNVVLFQQGIPGLWNPAWNSLINWWNFMETVFGGVFGAVMGLGLWRNRCGIRQPSPSFEAAFPTGTEWFLIALHVLLLISGEVLDLGYSEIGLVMGIIPLIGVAGGSRCPFLLIMPVTLIPIALKTAMQLKAGSFPMPSLFIWLVFCGLPLSLSILAAVGSIRKSRGGAGALSYTRETLLWATWLYFGLNFAVFRFPWPWSPWTARTPNALVFFVCALGLTACVWRRGGAGMVNHRKASSS
ncbi:MAG TPA: hypothetical protein PK256_20345 [Verrucomicrobiota bacterium]|nr:hypothetical protein [Verrucomicrobiota bacterium]